MPKRPALTLGIEEEYLIVDAETRALVREPVPAFRDALDAALGDRVSPEYLQCQVEVGTLPHGTVAEAIADLRQLRAAVDAAARAEGYRAIAASTHPFSAWRAQLHTRKERYDTLRADLGQAVRRLLICGMHIHIGIEDPDLRIDLMNQAAYFLPHLLAVSTSSPFWEGEDTGLASYRLTVFDALPRTGLPDLLNSHAEYRRLIGHLVDAGCIEDGTKIWWDIRPSDKFPTLEQRVTDICPRVEDAAAIAALCQSLIGYLCRLRSRNQRWRLYPRTMVMENRWRAQRYGVQGKLVDLGHSVLTPMSDLIEEIIALVEEDAEMLGCTEQLVHLRNIAAGGTSADRQRRVWQAARDAGADPAEAGRAVVDHLVAEFIA